MIKIKEKILSEFKKPGSFYIRKRKLNAPIKINGGGRVPAGKDKYSLIIQKRILIEYDNGVIREKTWDHFDWPLMSRYIRERDGQCLKCGSKKKLSADHFRPECYQWINWFFRASAIQTLCEKCHLKLPSMKTRSKNWKKYCFK